MNKGYSGPEHMSQAGATALMLRIRSYWMQQGYLPVLRVEPVGSTQGEIWVVRSNMVNGMPQGRVLAAVA